MSVTKIKYLVYGVVINESEKLDIIEGITETYKNNGILNEDDIEELLYNDYFDNGEALIQIVDQPVGDDNSVIGKIVDIQHDDDIKEINILTENEKHLVERELKNNFKIKKGPRYYLYTRFL